jgi:hypothetical protein
MKPLREEPRRRPRTKGVSQASNTKGGSQTEVEPPGSVRRAGGVVNGNASSSSEQAQDGTGI